MTKSKTNKTVNKRNSTIRQETQPLARIHHLARGPDSSGWQHDRERIAEVVMDGSGSFVCSVIQRVQPGLASFAPWLAETMGQGWVKYALKALEFIFITDVPTTVAGNLIMGWLPDATASLPTSMVEASQSAIYTSGNINSNCHLRVPKRELEEAFDDMKFTRQGVVVGDPNLYDCGVFFVATEGYSSLTVPPPDLPCVGFIDVNFDACFTDKQVPRSLVRSNFSIDNAEVSVFIASGSGAPNQPLLDWLPINNNPAGWMLNDLDTSQLYIPPGVFEVTVSCTCIGSNIAEWICQQDHDTLLEPPPVSFSGTNIRGSLSLTAGTTAGTIDDISSVTFIVGNGDPRVIPNMPTNAFSMYRTAMRFQVLSLTGTSFSPLLGDHIMTVRRLPTEGAEGLSGIGTEASTITSFLNAMQKYGVKHPSLRELLPESRLRSRAMEKAKALNEQPSATTTSKTASPSRYGDIPALSKQ